jgi:type II restriction enzyme
MKQLNIYKKLGIITEVSVFDYLINNLKDTIRTYDFYVAWNKVTENISKIEISLNIMNSLIGKKNIKQELKALIKAYPEIVPIIPILIACRENSLIVADTRGDIQYSFAQKKSYNDIEIDKIVFFSEQCGLLKILSDKKIKNLVDYCLGVEVGLDTNARKNRSGTAMENLTEFYVKSICQKYNYQYLSQATVSEIKSNFGKIVPTDKADRHFDFVINKDNKIYLIEVNYYSGGGSKLKSVAGEFKSLFELVKTKQDVCFIWITDGLGWKTAQRPLLETFNATDFVFNLKMLENGLLEEVIKNSL